MSEGRSLSAISNSLACSKSLLQSTEKTQNNCLLLAGFTAVIQQLLQVVPGEIFNGVWSKIEFRMERKKMLLSKGDKEKPETAVQETVNTAFVDRV